VTNDANVDDVDHPEFTGDDAISLWLWITALPEFSPATSMCSLAPTGEPWENVTAEGAGDEDLARLLRLTFRATLAYRLNKFKKKSNGRVRLYVRNRPIVTRNNEYWAVRFRFLISDKPWTMESEWGGVDETR
jgi:hypothetical protein